MALYSCALRDIPIAFAYPIQVGACLLIISLVATTWFGEKLGVEAMFGILLVAAGIAVLARVAR